MKIVQYFNMSPLKYGGLEKYFIKLVENSQEHSFFFIFNCYPVSKDFIDDCARLNIKILVADHGGYPVDEIKNSFWFYKMVKEIRPDIIQFHFGTVFNIFTRIARHFGVKKLFKMEHSCLIDKNCNQYTSFDSLPFQHRLLRSDKKGGISNFDKILCVSQFVKQQFVSINNSIVSPEKIEKIYLGVPAPRYYEATYKTILKEKLNIPKKTKIISTTLFAAWMKGLDILLKGVGQIMDKNFVLLIIGIDESAVLAKTYHEIANSLGIEGKLRWIGITDKVSQYLSISDIYVQPSRTEALSLAACEALSYSLPVVGSDVGGLPEVSSVTFSKENYQELGDILGQILDDESLCLTLREKAFDFYSKNLNIDQSINTLKNIYGI